MTGLSEDSKEFLRLYEEREKRTPEQTKVIANSLTKK